NNAAKFSCVGAVVLVPAVAMNMWFLNISPRHGRGSGLVDHPAVRTALLVRSASPCLSPRPASPGWWHAAAALTSMRRDGRPIPLQYEVNACGDCHVCRIQNK